MAAEYGHIKQTSSQPSCWKFPVYSSCGGLAGILKRRNHKQFSWLLLGTQYASSLSSLEQKKSLLAKQKEMKRTHCTSWALTCKLRSCVLLLSTNSQSIWVVNWVGWSCFCSVRFRILVLIVGRVPLFVHFYFFLRRNTKDIIGVFVDQLRIYRVFNL